ncbi:hypothetical protein HNV11_11540 [Spirosoma taeanense]|uniref:Right handed beta helix domain-containing protein n=1 Tax=Spirosoma taeanense TaxID=2735870 RepID=A0A6M5Y9S8_9BACT|nr:right-handed parallel beta-helix repeat-containing protein [Spirosoma taeanense]QJW89963.1 hypothetical protein HNV11_11540 [Spirosoma taeanense]
MKHLLILLTALLLVTCKRTIDDPAVTPTPTPPKPFVPKFIIDKAGVHNGASLGVQPGDTVAIQAGTYTNLILQGFVGAPGKPIIFLNYKGQVQIKGTTQNNGNFSINGCSYFVLTGSGTEGVQYGFDVSSTYKDVSALVVAGKSTNCEITRVEVSQSGFAGMMIKTDPSKNDPTTWLGNFVMKDVHVHDNYVHDTLGEGFYIGNSFWNTGLNGLYPHEIQGLHLHHNIVKRAGCEGIQYSCSPGASVHHNRVSQTGISPFSNSQNAGVQISGGSSGEFYNNTIDSAQGVGLIIVGAVRSGDSLVVRNVLVTNSNQFAGADKLPAETCAVFADERNTPPGVVVGGRLIFQNITVEGARLDGIRLYNQSQSNIIRKSIVRGFTRSAIDRSPKSVPLLEVENYFGVITAPAGIGYQTN